MWCFFVTLSESMTFLGCFKKENFPLEYLKFTIVFYINWQKIKIDNRVQFELQTVSNAIFVLVNVLVWGNNFAFQAFFFEIDVNWHDLIGCPLESIRLINFKVQSTSWVPICGLEEIHTVSYFWESNKYIYCF